MLQIAVMLVCFTFVSSVINMIYSRQLVLLYIDLQIMFCPIDSHFRDRMIHNISADFLQIIEIIAYS
jgi:hypothetical protein